MNPFESDTHYGVIPSETPITDDGYKIGEPKLISCDYCSAEELLTEEKSAGVDDLQHDPDCPQRFARSDWWRGQFEQLRPGYGSPSASKQPEAGD